MSEEYSPELIGMVAFVGAGLAFVVNFYLMPAITARSRGYSFFYWLLLSLGINPILALCVLAALPDRVLDERRAREGELLDQLLAQMGRRVPLAGTTPPARSLGDATTLR